MRRAMGLMAGPERPPVTLARRGRRVSGSMDMARNVLVRLTALAPAWAAMRAMWAMEITLGESLTMSGRLEAVLARLTRYSNSMGSAPKAMPPAWTLGQETLSS